MKDEKIIYKPDNVIVKDDEVLITDEGVKDINDMMIKMFSQSSSVSQMLIEHLAALIGDLANIKIHDNNTLSSITGNIAAIEIFMGALKQELNISENVMNNIKGKTYYNIYSTYKKLEEGK